MLFAATVAGLVALWPPPDRSHRDPQALGGRSLPATVTRARTVRCPGPFTQACRQIQARLKAGPDRGSRTTITLGPARTSPKLAVGDSIRVDRLQPPPRGTANAGPPAEQYSFFDYDRRGSMLWLALAFGVLAIVLARVRGLLALVGFALSLLLVIKFLVPAMLAGSPPLLVALVSSLAVMFVTLALTNGVGAQSFAAALGISGSLLLAALLGQFYVHLAHLNGYSSELSQLLAQNNLKVSLEGIVIAGFVIGALGVLADMAVTQASAVMALRRANPRQGPRALYTGAFTVGRDHLAATINTLVLAYVGASLPLLLVLHGASVGFQDAINTQDVAEPIIASLIGAIALIAAVPLTTGLAALLVVRVPVDALPEDAHGHHH